MPMPKIENSAQVLPCYIKFVIDPYPLAQAEHVKHT
jgi:hypothetical protein